MAGAGYQREKRRGSEVSKAKGPLSSGPASEALRGDSGGRKRGPAEMLRKNGTRRDSIQPGRLVFPEVASGVVCIDAVGRRKLAGPVRFFLARSRYLILKPVSAGSRLQSDEVSV
jgi:hypothetical protein